MPKIKRKCQRKGCLNMVEAWPSQIRLGLGKYCSTECNNLGQRKGEVRECERDGCSNTFYAKAYSIQKGWGRYCSIRCRNISRGRYSNRTEFFVCEQCGDTYPLSGRKLYEALRYGRRFCGVKCVSVYMNKKKKEKKEMAKSKATEAGPITETGEWMEKEHGKPTNEAKIGDLEKEIEEREAKIELLKKEAVLLVSSIHEVEDEASKLEEEAKDESTFNLPGTKIPKIVRARKRRKAARELTDILTLDRLAIALVICDDYQILILLKDSLHAEKEKRAKREMRDAFMPFMDDIA